jgi:hypothetical protein
MTSYNVTLYKLFLGEQDSVTGHYQRGFTVHSVVMAIFPRGTAFSFNGIGYYTRYDKTGYTNYDLYEGDIILDSFGKYYTIKSLKPWTQGDQFLFYECELEESPYFSLPTSASLFIGFEVITEGVMEFETGFERGYLTEIIY